VEPAYETRSGDELGLLPTATPAPSRPPGTTGRGRAASLWLGAAAVLVVGGVLGATYALGVPPGSLLRREAAAATPAAATLVLAADFSQQEFPSGNPATLAVKLYLDQVKRTAGGHRLDVKPYDIASPAHKRWDSAACQAAARRHLAARDEIAVIGPYNSGCAKLAVPILGKDPESALTVISNGSTDPGLTKAWDAGEPG
jgi:branched-chain amino acid transport system substrate-binding protein